MKRKPANFVSHDLHDKYTVVGSCCSMNAVNNACRDIQRTLKTKGNIGTVNIIVDGFWQMNDVQTFLTKQVCCFLCTVTAKDYQTVKVQFVVSVFHRLYLVQSVCIRHTHIFERLAGCSKNRTALCQNSGKIFGCQQTIISIDQSFVSIIKTVNLQFIQIGI